MGFRYHKSKKDSNHNAIESVLRAHGMVTLDVSALRCGFDIIAAYNPLIVEVKDGSLPPSRQTLTRDEEDAQRRYGVYYHVINSTEAAARAALRNRQL